MVAGETVGAPEARADGHVVLDVAPIDLAADVVVAVRAGDQAVRTG